MKQLRLPEVEGTFRITGKDLEKNSDATNYSYFVVEKVLRGTLYVDGELYSSGDRIVEHSSALTWSAPAGAANATNPVFIVHVATDHARVLKLGACISPAPPKIPALFLGVE